MLLWSQLYMEVLKRALEKGDTIEVKLRGKVIFRARIVKDGDGIYFYMVETWDIILPGWHQHDNFTLKI